MPTLWPSNFARWPAPGDQQRHVDLRYRRHQGVRALDRRAFDGQIDGCSSSEVWASFRVGRRARPLDVEANETTAEIVVSARHDGYRFLPGRPVHARRLAIADDAVTITDAISGAGSHVAIGRLPLHPSVVSAEQRDRGWLVECGGGRRLEVIVDGPVALSLEEGSFAAEFGVRQARKVLVWRAEAILPMTVATTFRL